VSDGYVAETREEISRVDLELLTAMNRRLELVRALHERKLASGIPLRDPGREEEMLKLLDAANEGPLSADGVADLLRYVLELTRKELHGE
jgi:chorismate mutase